MTDTSNPWLTGADEVPPQPLRESPEIQVPPVTGPSRPQLGIPAPAVEARLPVQQQRSRAPLFWVGAHGGSGETSLEALAPQWSATDHTWPLATAADRARVVVVARTHMSGLLAAQSALTQWASGGVPFVDVLGVVFIADAPGRIPRLLRDFATVVAGGAPRRWDVPWIESWRLGETPTLGEAPGRVTRLIEELNSLLPGALRTTK